MSTAPRIHPTAVVDPAARLGEGVTVDPQVVIEADVEVGAGSRVRSGSVLLAGSRVGTGCRIGPCAVIGGEPLDRAFGGEASVVRLGDGVEVREFATVHRATGEGAETTVERGALLMCYVHVAHNCRVGEGAVITNSSQLGGHSSVGEFAVLGGGALVHQFVRIGAHAMLGGASGANRDVLPFAMAVGKPARHLRLNRVGLQRRGFEGERYRTLERALRACRRGERATLEALAADSDDVSALLAFIDGSRRGVSGFGLRGWDS